MGMKALAQISLTQTKAALQAAGTGHVMAQIQADPGNVGTLLIGDVDTQIHKLTAGKSDWFGPDSPTNIYVKSTEATGDKANVLLYTA